MTGSRKVVAQLPQSLGICRSLDPDGSYSSADRTAAILRRGHVRTNEESTGLHMENAIIVCLKRATATTTTLTDNVSTKKWYKVENYGVAKLVKNI